MEFAELILTSKVENIVLHNPHNKPLDGILCITGHFIIVFKKDGAQVLWLLHSNIDYIDRKQAGNVQLGGSLILKCKDLRIITIDLFTLEDFTNVAVSLERLISLGSPDDCTKLYPFFYRPPFTVLEDGWTAFRPETEFNKLVTTYSDEWRISYLNQDFKVCPTYPSAVVVPKSIDDDTIIAAAGFREGGRFPVLSYRHDTGSVLMRSSQPLPGPQNRRCKEDEKLLNSLLGPGRRGYVVDTRSQSVAAAAKTKGGGTELEMFYPQWRRVHRPVERFLIESLAKLLEGCNDLSISMSGWLGKLDSSSWLSHVRDALNCACLVAQCLDQERSSVLVHGSDGTDTALVVTSLAQVILSPDCRTVRGLEALIEREWLQAGHPFSIRHHKSVYHFSHTSTNSKSCSPSFLLFLDCLSQIYNQFPCCFEFNLAFLSALFQHSYSSQFGTFLGNCEADRDRLKLSESTVSLWSFVNRPDTLQQYLNCLYDPNNSVTWPSVAPVSMNLWSELYLSHVVDLSSSEGVAQEAVAALKAKDTELRHKAGRLRRHLQELEREAVSLGLLQTPGEPLAGL